MTGVIPVFLWKGGEKMNIKNTVMSGAAAGVMMLSSVLPAFAATTVVTPTNTQGWSTADTRPGGAVTFVADADAPGGDGALQLTTDATTTSKAQYMHEASTPITDITELSYYSKQISASFPQGDASYQLAIDTNGTETGGFTTLVYEPYQNGTVVPNTWTQHDVDQGQFWSSRSITCSNGSLTAGGGGTPFYTLSDVKTMCPEAVVVGFGVNIGSSNPSYTINTDLVTFNGTTYDFELVEPGPVVNEPTSKDACKNGGYKTLTNSEGDVFRNQGQCVSYFNHM